jgi:phospholipase/lecithinase/hemolysin
MATQWLRRAWLLAAGASVLLLAACGGGDVESQLVPSRIVVFGDAMADIGQNPTGQRYTVNDGSTNNWTLEVARRYGTSIAPARAGGFSYAQGNARVSASPGAGGDTSAPPVVDQVTTFLSANSLTPNDLVLVSAGTSDVIVQARAVMEGAQSRDQMLANLTQAGRDLGAQVRRLVDAGARHVAVVGPYNLGRSPWAKQTGQADLLEAASREFNNRFLLSVEDLGETVLFIDAAELYNRYEGTPGNYGLDNVDSPVCTSVDAGEGIGTGTGQINSLLCTSATISAGADYNAYLFADRIYPTPRGHFLFGDNAFNRIHERW